MISSRSSGCFFGICVQCDGLEEIGPTGFDSWNYENDDKVVRSKVGTIGDEGIPQDRGRGVYALLPPTASVGE